MNDQFKQNALNTWGEGAKDWLDNIPKLIKVFEEKWSIKVDKPFELSYNYTAPARRQNGEEVVLKIGFPEDKEFKSEIEALKIFNGEGSVKLLESDLESCVILLERVKPGENIESLEDDIATKVIASIIKKIHKGVPENNNLLLLSDWYKGFEKYIKEYGSKGPLPFYLINKAQKTFKELIESQGELKVLHGDLHHGNILLATREPYLTIDPKGVIGESEYEVSAMMRNPYLKIIDEKVLERRIDILSDELGFDKKRITSWGFAQTILSCIWSIEDKTKGWTHSLNIGKTLLEL